MDMTEQFGDIAAVCSAGSVEDTESVSVAVVAALGLLAGPEKVKCAYVTSAFGEDEQSDVTTEWTIYALTGTRLLRLLLSTPYEEVRSRSGFGDEKAPVTLRESGTSWSRGQVPAPKLVKAVVWSAQSGRSVQARGSWTLDWDGQSLNLPLAREEKTQAAVEAFVRELLTNPNL